MAIKYERYETGDDADRNCGTYYRAQTFTPQLTHKISSIFIKVWGPSANPVGFNITTTSEGAPTTTVLASGNLDRTGLPESAPGEWREISLGAGATLEAGVTYAIAAAGKHGSLQWRSDNSSPAYTGGAAYYSSDGISWTAESRDSMFQEWGVSLGGGAKSTSAAKLITAGAL
ncbi:MAG: hypothetical protein PHQ43_08355 [Dehalococcoidales bacterium]|nr:hypothetical protein [Dehalococcoidales bacterium]